LKLIIEDGIRDGDLGKGYNGERQVEQR